MEKKPTKKAAAPKKTAAAKDISVPSAEVKTAPRRKSKNAMIDPFAEVAESAATASPAKKSPPKTVKAKAATSSVKKAVKKTVKKAAASAADVTADIAAAKPAVELSPVFKALAEPALPELTRENRARLLMQTPTRIYFYWAIKENPWHLLKNAFGSDTGSYTLVLKLTNLRSGHEQIHPCDAAGNWWFDVEPDGEYQAEVGFYATNRPYFRIIYSNTVETPRRSPSPHPASEARWMISAGKFAEVLDGRICGTLFDVARRRRSVADRQRTMRSRSLRVNTISMAFPPKIYACSPSRPEQRSRTCDLRSARLCSLFCGKCRQAIRKKGYGRARRAFRHRRGRI